MSHQDCELQNRGRKAAGKKNSAGQTSGKKSPGKKNSRKRTSVSGELPQLNSVYLAQALQWILSGVSWLSIGLRGDCTWTPRRLAVAALLWAWSDESTLGERFLTARRLAVHLEPLAGPLAGSYQAFIYLLQRWTKCLVRELQLAFQKRIRTALSASWSISGYIVFGVDGSRIELPRTKSHEAAYSPSPKRSGKKKHSRRKRPQNAAHTKKANVPQMWLTVMLHIATGLPWDWRFGPSDSSERGHALDMLSGLPAGSLLTADAGFVGYEFVRTVLAAGHQLLVRVGSNVRLLKKLGYSEESSGTVYLWPDRTAKRRQPPLVLRLVIVRGARHPVYLLTSVTDVKKLSDKQLGEVYRRRWDIELFYRHLKQTFQRRKLRSTCAANAALELEWSLAGLWAMGLFAASTATKAKVPLRRLSIAGILRAFRRLMRDYLHAATPDQSLCRQLRQARIDDYTRKSKSSRDYPRKKPHDRPGPPHIKKATRQQIQQAQGLKSPMIAKKG